MTELGDVFTGFVNANYERIQFEKRQDEAILLANRNYDRALQQKQQKQRREDMKIRVIFCLGRFTGLLLLMALMCAFCILTAILM